MLKDVRSNCFCNSLLRSQIHRPIVDFHRPIVDIRRLIVGRWRIVFVSGVSNLAPRAFFVAWCEKEAFRAYAVCKPPYVLRDV